MIVMDIWWWRSAADMFLPALSSPDGSVGRADVQSAKYSPHQNSEQSPRAAAGWYNSSDKSQGDRNCIGAIIRSSINIE